MRSATKLALPCIIVALLASLLPPSADASEPTPEQRAAVYYADAGAAYKEGRYAEAVALLEKAYALSPRPEILQNLGRAHQRMGHLAEAVAAFEKYLATDPFAKDRAAISSEVTAMKSEIDEAAAKQRAADEAADVARRAALDESRRAAWQKWMDDLRHRDELERERHHASAIPWIVFGIGVAGAINGAVFAGIADSRHRAAADPSLDQTTARRTQDQATTFASVANISFIAGGAVALGGLVWGIVDVLVTAKSRQRAGSGPVVGPGWLGWSGTF